MTKSKERIKTDDLHDLVADKFQKVISTDLKRELEDNIRSLAKKVLQEVLQEENLSKLNQNHVKNISNKKTTLLRKDTGSGKVFTARNSLLTDLFEVSHIKTVYNIFVVILILLFLNLIVYDLVDSGKINVGLGLILHAFGKIHTVAIIWICMQISAIFPYIGLNLWAKWRYSIYKYSYKLSKIWDITAICIYVMYQILFLICPISIVLHVRLPIASAIIVLLEMIRFMMKTHAYVRSVSPRVLNNSIHTSSKVHLPSFSWYIYFLFAPTMIYRDSYPRTNYINWKHVALRILEVVAVIFYISFLCERFLIHNWANFGKADQIFEAKQMVLTLFASILPGLITFLCGFYLLLHSWHNASAEILTFADRRFYMDWWTQSDYGGYYRTWNMVVHDWLHTYIYKDIIVLTGNRLFGQLSVFLISAAFHELVITFAFGFFYPVLMVLFGGFGVFLIFITKHANPTIGNIVMWLTLALGNGILWSMYGIEYFARINCPMTVDNKVLDFVIPRSWFCHRIVFTPNWKFNNPFE